MPEFSVPRDSTFTKQAFWLESDSGAIFVWLYLPQKENLSNTGIVLCPPIGHEYVHSHRTYRYAAENLASVGVTVLRFDYYGIGDSEGSMLDRDLFDIWKNNVIVVIEHLESFSYIENIGTFGVRMGATLALLAAKNKSSSFCILWNPIINGKRYVRELTAISRMSTHTSNGERGFYEAGGFPITKELENHLKSINLLKSSDLKIKNTLYLKGSEVNTAQENLLEILSTLTHIETKEIDGYEQMMYEPQFAEVPTDLLNELECWVGNYAEFKSNSIQNDIPISGRNSWRNEKIYEYIYKNNSGLFAISCQPVDSEPPMLFILANSGSVHHVGPNRLYIELSRELALAGAQVLRVDLRNLGDSADCNNKSENITYPDTACDDIIAFIKELKSNYPDKKIVLGGVCSGAYHAFHTALRINANILSEVIVINPLVFYWKEGMSLEIPAAYKVNKDAKYYEGSLRQWKSWKKFITGKVDYIYLFRFLVLYFSEKIKLIRVNALSALNLTEKSQLAKDTIEIIKKNISINFVFSSTDPGYGILKDEGGYTVKKLIKNGTLSIFEISGSDHTFSKAHFRKNLTITLENILNL